jgi:hypothetical protein
MVTQDCAGESWTRPWGKDGCPVRDSDFGSHVSSPLIVSLCYR